jgi:uncharacterized protein (DUF983 family)
MTSQPDTRFRTELWRGLTGRCPHCGQGRMFRAFLKVADRCEVCGEEFHHHRADDLPAYLVIVVVGHVMVGVLLLAESLQLFGYWAEVSIFVSLTLFLALALIQPMKGVVVAMQWHLGMHGFAQAKARTAGIRRGFGET